MWWGLPAGAKDSLYKLSTLPVKDASPVAWFDFQGAKPPSDFDPHPSLQIVVQEPDAAGVSWTPIGGVLDTLCWWVEWHILGMRFRPLFP